MLVELLPKTIVWKVRLGISIIKDITNSVPHWKVSIRDPEAGQEEYLDSETQH